MKRNDQTSRRSVIGLVLLVSMLFYVSGAALGLHLQLAHTHVTAVMMSGWRMGTKVITRQPMTRIRQESIHVNSAACSLGSPSRWRSLQIAVLWRL